MEKNLELMANWWAEQVCKPSLNWNNGDRSESGGMAFILGNLIANKVREKISADTYEKFKKIFVELALNFYADKGYLPGFCVDYHPSAFLAAVAKHCNISEDAFPCKSYTVIENNEALACCGDGEQFVIV